MNIKLNFLLICLVLLLCNCSSDDPEDNNAFNGSIEISSVVDITNSSALITVSLSSEGAISAKGVCWSTTPNPTLADNSTNEGSTNGSFETELNFLEANTTYFIRAYVTTNQGTFYSGESQFDTNGGIYVGGIVIRTQQELDEFGSNNYIGMTGNIRLQESVTDLTPLSTLTFVRQLIVKETTDLVSIEGLENIESVKDLRIYENEMLTSIDPIANISSIEGHITINRNDNLMSISGLNDVSGEVEYIVIESNAALESVSGLNNITSTVFGVSFFNNEALQIISGLSGLQTIGDGLYINRNDNLVSFVGLSNLQSTVFNVEVRENSSLQNLEGLEGLISVGGSLVITENDSLVDFCALQNLLINGNLAGSYDVNSNAYNPTVQDIIDGNCSL